MLKCNFCHIFSLVSFLSDERLQKEDKKHAETRFWTQTSRYSLQFLIVSGFERTCHLFRTRSYKVVSPSDYVIRIRTPNIQCCLFWLVSRKNRNENKIKLSFWWISNVSERLFRSGIVSIWKLPWDIFKLHLMKNCFYFISLPTFSFTMTWCLL